MYGFSVEKLSPHRYVAHISGGLYKKTRCACVECGRSSPTLPSRERCFTSSQSLSGDSGRGARAAARCVDNMTAGRFVQTQAAAPGEGARAAHRCTRRWRPGTGARAAWRCMLCGPAAAPRTRRRGRRAHAALRPRPRDRPPCRGGRGARAEVPAFTISGGLIKYISCVGDLTTLIAGRRRRRPRGTSSTGELVPGFTPATPFAATPLQRLRRDTQAARWEVARSEHAVAAAISRPALCSASKLLREDAPSTFGTKHESNQKGEWRQRCDKRVEAEPGCVVDRCVRVRK